MVSWVLMGKGVQAFTSLSRKLMLVYDDDGWDWSNDFVAKEETNLDEFSNLERDDALRVRDWMRGGGGLCILFSLYLSLWGGCKITRKLKKKRAKYESNKEKMEKPD
jgi:hypothetical protein